MYAEEEKKRIISLVANFAILVFETVSFALVWYEGYDSPYYYKGNFAVIMLYCAFSYLLTKGFNGYKISYMRISNLLVSNVLAIVFAGLAAFILVCMAMGETVTPIPVIVMASIQIVFTIVWIVLVKILYIHFYPPRRLIVIYGNYPLETFLGKLNTRTDKYNVSEILNYQQGMERIRNDVLDFEGVVLYDLPAEERNTIIKYCYKNSIRIYVVPKITDIIMRGSDDLYLVDTPLFLSRNQGLHVDQRFVKRTMDIIISLIGIVVVSPIMLITAIAIKVYDRGPVFYRQIRLTRGGKQFKIIKFRSMSIDAESHGAQLARKNDSRITPVGRVIRRLHIDELPQLFNVLMGDMSLVGPRPERPEIFEKYSDSISEFDFRLKVKAGITGYAQVYGKYNTTPIDKLKLDLLYIQQYSFWLDIKLMFLTLRIVFSKDSSEGVDKGQTTALHKEEE